MRKFVQAQASAAGGDWRSRRGLGLDHRLRLQVPLSLVGAGEACDGLQRSPSSCDRHGSPAMNLSLYLLTVLIWGTTGSP